MGVIEDYWSGVLQRLQAEVNVFNRLIAHQGERGRENEQAIARVLEGLVPRRFGVGTGLLFDSIGDYSRQLDVVIYDQIDSPTVLSQTAQLLYPLEEVLASIEVKTTLNKAEIDDAAKKKRSIRSLKPKDGYVRDSLFGLFAYDAETSPETIKKNLMALEPGDRPDLVCVLDPGIVAGRRSVLKVPDGDPDFCAGVTLLLGPDADAPVPASAESFDSHQQRDGSLYPVVQIGADRYLSDPSRALLLFCDALVRHLAVRDGRQEPVMSAYLSDGYRLLHAQ
jgi:hypothetical protein